MNQRLLRQLEVRCNQTQLFELLTLPCRDTAEFATDEMITKLESLTRGRNDHRSNIYIA